MGVKHYHQTLPPERPAPRHGMGGMNQSEETRSEEMRWLIDHEENIRDGVLCLSLALWFWAVPLWLISQVGRLGVLKSFTSLQTSFSLHKVTEKSSPPRGTWWNICSNASKHFSGLLIVNGSLSHWVDFLFSNLFFFSNSMLHLFSSGRCYWLLFIII